MLSCREDLTAATWPEQLGKRTVVGFSSSHRGTAGYSRTELLLCLAAGGAAFRYLTHEYNWIVTVEMLLAFAALGNSAAPGTSARAHVNYRRLRTVLFFGRLLEVCLNSTRMLQKIIMSIIVGGI